MIVTAVCVCCIGAAAALVWYFTAGRDDSGKQTASVTTVSPEDAGATGSSTTLSPSGGGTSSTSSLPSGGSGPTISTSATSPLTTSSPSTSLPGGSPDDSLFTVFTDETVGSSFLYPASWTEFPQETVIDLVGPPTVGIAVADPNAGLIGSVPTSYIAFGAYQDTALAAPPAREAMEEWAAMAEPEAPLPLTPMGPMVDFEVNGVAGASKTYSLVDQGHPLIKKICFLSSGMCIYIFTFCAEERDWAGVEALYDAVLDSFTVNVVD